MVSVVGFVNGFRRGGKALFMVSVAGLLVDSAAAGGPIILECIERFLVVCVFKAGFRRWICMVSVVAGNVFYGFRRWFVYGFCRGKELVYGFRRFCFYGFRLLQSRGCLSDGNHTKKKHQDVSVTN